MLLLPLPWIPVGGGLYNRPPFFLSPRVYRKTVVVVGKERIVLHSAAPALQTESIHVLMLLLCTEFSFAEGRSSGSCVRDNGCVRVFSSSSSSCYYFELGQAKKKKENIKDDAVFFFF